MLSNTKMTVESAFIVSGKLTWELRMKFISSGSKTQTAVPWLKQGQFLSMF